MRGSPEDGRTPPIEALLQPGVLVCDLVYNPLETPLLRLAKQKGAKTLGGLGMLVYQGAAAFTLWTGREAPIGVMYAAAREALG
jgi:shikimate dehydrogenase